MKKRTGIALAAAALGLLAAPAVQAQQSNRELTKGEAKLARMLEGRVAGEPQSCISTLPSRSFTVIDDTALVYRDGTTLWVNTTRNPSSVDDDHILVIDRFSGSRLCRNDQVTMRDRSSGFFSGVLFFEDFVPYQRVEG